MRTEIVIVLDRSGSMDIIRDDIIGGFNAFVEEQRKIPGEAYVTLAQFDTGGYDVMFERKPLASVPRLTRETFVPRAGTPLLDAIGRTVTQQGARFDRARADEKPEKVVLAIITDGLENSSVMFTKADVMALLKRQQEEWNWSVTYIGANQDAIQEGAAIGIARAQSLTFAACAGGVKGMTSALNAKISHERVYGSTYAYSIGDRNASMEDKES